MLRQIALLVVLALTLASCTTVVNVTEVTNITVTQLVGPAGGTVELADGGKVVIPPGALTETLPIKITKLELDDVAPVPSNLAAAGKPVAFEPHGTVFLAPVKIEVPFEGSANEVRPLKLDDEDDTTWQTLVGSEKQNGKLSINVTTFSVILAARPRRDSGVITLPDGAIVEDAGNTAIDSGADAAQAVDAAVQADATAPLDASCEPNACSPDQCGNLGLNSDGCGGSLDCGNCPSGEYCNLPGAPNVCTVCFPRTVCDQDECGLASDDCGGTLDCGSCVDPDAGTAIDAGSSDASTQCPPGYGGTSPNCFDLNECAVSNGGCHPSAICTNTPGSFTCACNVGFVGNGVTCNDINECSLEVDNCDDTPDACVNTLGSFMCTCPSGYSGDGITCTAQ